MRPYEDQTHDGHLRQAGPRPPGAGGGLKSDPAPPTRGANPPGRPSGRPCSTAFDTRDRDKKGYLADKNRYQPWSGAPMEGRLDLEWQGRDITLRRGPKGSTPFGTFSAVYTGTEEAVPGLTAANCGRAAHRRGPGGL